MSQNKNPTMTAYTNIRQWGVSLESTPILTHVIMFYRGNVCAWRDIWKLAENSSYSAKSKASDFSTPY